MGAKQLHTWNTQVILHEPKHIQIWPRNTETERSSVNHIVDMINIVMFTIETTPSHVMIGHGLVDLDHVIT